MRRRNRICYTEITFEITCPRSFGFPNRAKGHKRITCPPRVLKAIYRGMSRYANTKLPEGFSMRCTSPCW